MTVMIFVNVVVLMFFMNNLFIGLFGIGAVFMLFFVGMNFIMFDYIKGDLYGMFGVGNVSGYMIVLSLWLVFLIFMVTQRDFLLSSLFMSILIIMMMMFMSMDFMGFFLFFESSIVPMFVMIYYYGSSKERYLSGLYMLIYTLMGSLMGLYGLLLLYSSILSLSMDLLSYYDLYIMYFVKFLVVFMFLVKVPMFIIYIWLPKAHVEAPVYGSMILASLMLKMGGYGLICIMLMFDIDLFMIDYFMVICVVGGVYISYICLYQVDFKVLVAYSSIVHMGSMLIGFFSGTDMGFAGGVYMMIYHGICSSLMFYMVNWFYYSTGSRLMMFGKGIMGIFPLYSVFWLICLVNNLGVPPSMGIMPELCLMVSLFNYNLYMFIFIIIQFFFVSCFVIIMYVSLVSGSFIGIIKNYMSIMIYVILFNFFFSMNVSILFIYNMF